MRKTIFVAFVVLTALGHDRAFAQFEGPGWGTVVNQIGLYNAMDTLRRNHETIFGQPIEESLRASNAGKTQNKATALRADAGTTELSATTFLQPRDATGQRISSVMAQSYPEASRDQAEKLFEQLLAGFKKIESQFDLPSNDVATAVAAFLVGSYSAYRNVDVPDDQFVPLVNQMRQIVGNTPAFAQATAGEKQATYEQLAILGMFMATTKMALDRQPNERVAQEAKKAAGGYLQTFLDTHPDRVRISARGLELR